MFAKTSPRGKPRLKEDGKKTLFLEPVKTRTAEELQLYKVQALEEKRTRTNHPDLTLSFFSPMIHPCFSLAKPTESHSPREPR